MRLMLKRFAVFCACCSFFALNCYGIELDFLRSTTVDVTIWQHAEAYLADAHIAREKLSRIREQKVFEIIKRHLAKAELISNSVAFCQAMQWWYQAQTGLHYEQ